ncbi:MAG: NAD+ synthase [Alphaproteobacteria bacterium]
MTDGLRIALAQLNPTVGDLAANVALLAETRDRAAAEGADLLLSSELFLVGYPPEDLVLKPALQREARKALEALAAKAAGSGPDLLVTLPWADDTGLHNAVAHLAEGKVAALRFKHELPNYGVFDEVRVFRPGPLPEPVTVCGVQIGVPICEDIWFPHVPAALKKKGAEILLVPNGSPFEHDKREERLDLARDRAKETGLPLVYLNQVGGQDELVFDGSSFAINADGKIAVQLAGFAPDFAVTEWRRGKAGWVCEKRSGPRPMDDLEAIYRAMVLGLGDYVRKNRFPGVVIGLSGGIDSALTAAVAVDALGPERVRCVKLPSRFTAEESNRDAEACAHALGARIEEIGIEPAVEIFLAMLRPVFKGTSPDTTEENIQSRVRGLILMALSNKFGEMVVTTGNKSEMSVGYATLYGDMCGGFNPLKDLYKTQVYAVAKWRNAHRPASLLGPQGRVIPEHTIARAPTAELRANQLDTDSLPPYPVLDDILECLIEKEMAIADIVARGHKRETVARIEGMLYVAEYKRRQAPPGVKITRKNFGRDRRYPVTNRFRDVR